MITVEEARQKILHHIPLTGQEHIAIEFVQGRILAEEVISPVDYPLFDQTAVDGYAFRYIQQKDSLALKVQGIIQAGDKPFDLMEGHAARIFTGAPIPFGADTVVMQEQTEILDNHVKFKLDGIAIGANVRYRGEQTKTGEMALSQNTRLNPASVGLLKSLGIDKVCVRQRPSIGILATGNEFVPEGSVPEPGQIFESNSSMLHSLLHQSGIANIGSRQSGDDKDELARNLVEVEKERNIVLITGGVSVGDFDFTPDIIKQAGYDIIFHKVAQKPGKPLLFARKGDQAIFGLPGNPQSVLVAYYEYVYPYMIACMGIENPFLTSIELPVVEGRKSHQNRSEFLPASVGGQSVRLLSAGGSHMLQPYSDANAIAYIPAGNRKIEPGQLVEVHLLPQ